jgi:hypothetical protein
MRSKKGFYSAITVIFLFLLGIGSAYFSCSSCEQETVVSVFIAGGAVAPPRISAHKTDVNGKIYDYSDSKVIVDTTLLYRPHLQSILLNRQKEQQGWVDLGDEDCYLSFSFSRGKVIFPFIVATDVEVKYVPIEGGRIYYLAFFGYVWKIKHKVTYRIDSVDK